MPATSILNRLAPSHHGGPPIYRRRPFILLILLTSLLTILLITWKREPIQAFLDPANRNGLTCQERIKIARVPEADWFVQYTPGKSQALLDTGATVISAKELLDGSYPAHLNTTIHKSRIIHQSWKTHDASGYPLHELWHSQDWWRALHPGWVYVLWDNADNRELARRKFPELLETFDGFQHEIARADFSRNLYLHAFGGIYSDLDVLPLRNILNHLPPFRDDAPSSYNHPIAYVGEMLHGGTLGIPNAWMASSQPGHPLWKNIYERTVEGVKDGKDPHSIERLTGPEPLYLSVVEFQKKYGAGKVRRSLLDDVEEGMERRAAVAKDGEGEAGPEVVILESPRIFPYSWAEPSKAIHCICSAKNPDTFDPRRCISLYKDAWTITFWGSAWFRDM